MAFADSIRTATASLDGAAPLLEALLLNRASASRTGSVINTTSTSFTDYTSLSVALTVPSGGRLIIEGTITGSASASGTTVSAQFTEDGSAIGVISAMASARNDTNGFDFTIPLKFDKAPSAGSHTYKIQWKTSTGTAYSATGYLLAYTLRDS